MAPELKDLSHKERFEEIGLPAIQERRVRRDLITMFQLVNNMERVHTEDLVCTVLQMEEGERRITIGHGMKIKKSRYSGDIKKYSFPYRTIDSWTDLKEEVVAANGVHMFKEKLEKNMFMETGQYELWHRTI